MTIRCEREDDGFTLVEMMASLIVIALVAAAFVATFVSSAKASQWNELRVAATQLGQQRLETAVSQPWTDVGLFSTGAGYRATANSEPTVTLAVGPHGTAVPLPLDSVPLRGISYAVRTDITWRDDPTDGLGAADTNGSTQDIKHIVITISWTAGSRSLTTSFEDLRSANATDVPPTATGAQIGVTVSAPASQPLTATGFLSNALTITAITSRVAASTAVVFSTRNGLQTTAMTTTNGGTAWTVTLPTTVGPFDTGVLAFGVTAKSTTGNGSGSALVLLTAGAATVKVDAAPSQVLGAGYVLTSPINVQVTSSATITSGTVSYPTRAGTATRPLSSSNGSWAYTVPVDASTYGVGVLTFTVTVGFADGSSGTGTGSVTLYEPSLPPDVTNVVVNDPYSTTSPVQSFCISSSKQTLFTATTIDATVLNVTSTDVVQLNAPNYTGSSYYAMTYLSTNADGSKVFRLTVAAGTAFPASGSILLKVHSEKSINGVVVGDDYFATVPIQSVSKSSSCA